MLAMAMTEVILLPSAILTVVGALVPVNDVGMITVSRFESARDNPRALEIRASAIPPRIVWRMRYNALIDEGTALNKGDTLAIPVPRHRSDNFA